MNGPAEVTVERGEGDSSERLTFTLQPEEIEQVPDIGGSDLTLGNYGVSYSVSNSLASVDGKLGN